MKISIAVHIARSAKLWKQKVAVNESSLLLRNGAPRKRGALDPKVETPLCKYRKTNGI